MSHWGMGNWRGSPITGHIQIELDACWYQESLSGLCPYKFNCFVGERGPYLGAPAHRENPRRPRHFLKQNPQLALRRQCPLLPWRCKNLCRVLQQSMSRVLRTKRDLLPGALPSLWFPSCPKLAYKWVSAHKYSWDAIPGPVSISAGAPSQSLGNLRTWLEGSGPSLSSRAL